MSHYLTNDDKFRDLLYGDDYTWYMLVTLSKAPVEWDFEEAEPNDSVDEAEDFALDQTAFATISSAAACALTRATYFSFTDASPWKARIFFIASVGIINGCG